MDALPAAEVSDGSVTAKALENNADLLLGGELAAGDALDIPYKLFGFCCPDICLLGSIGYSLSHDPAPFLIDTLLFRGSRCKP